MTTTTDTPRVYVASLSDYNAGRLHGRWIDANQDADDIMAEIRAMLAESPENSLCQWCGDGLADHVLDANRRARNGCRGWFPGNAEEWAIHDYDNFGGLSLSEYESIGKVSELGQLIAEHGGAFAAYASMVGADYATAEGFEEAYAGEWESERDFAYHYAESTNLFHGLADNHPAVTYFNWDYWTRDLFMCDYDSSPTADYRVYVFRAI